MMCTVVRFQLVSYTKIYTVKQWTNRRESLNLHVGYVTYKKEKGEGIKEFTYLMTCMKQCPREFI